MIRTPYSHIPHGSTCYVFCKLNFEAFFYYFCSNKGFFYTPSYLKKRNRKRRKKYWGCSVLHGVPLVPWLSKKVSNGIRKKFNFLTFSPFYKNCSLVVKLQQYINMEIVKLKKKITVSNQTCYRE